MVLVVKSQKHMRVFQATFMKQYPTFFVVPGGIHLSICRACDLSNFMVCKCNFLQLKGLLEGWMEGKCCLPQARGWVQYAGWAGESLMVAVTIICGCSYDTEPDYAFWTNSIWSSVVGKTFYRWSHNKRTSAPVAIWRWMNLIPLLQNDWSGTPIRQRHTYPHAHTQKHTRGSPSYYYSVKLQRTVLIEFPLWSRSRHRGIKRADDLSPLLYNISKCERRRGIRSSRICWSVESDSKRLPGWTEGGMKWGRVESEAFGVKIKRFAQTNRSL